VKKKTIAASMLGLTLFGFGVVAYADSNLEQISAYINHGIHINLNGSVWKPSSDPITYDGTTYLPVRSAAEAIGA
jgi:hypothetical protein